MVVKSLRKWRLQKLSRSKEKTPEAVTPEEEEATVQCDSDTSSSLIDKTQVIHQFHEDASTPLAARNDPIHWSPADDRLGTDVELVGSWNGPQTPDTTVPTKMLCCVGGNTLKQKASHPTIPASIAAATIRPAVSSNQRLLRSDITESYECVYHEGDSGPILPRHVLSAPAPITDHLAEIAEPMINAEPGVCRCTSTSHAVPSLDPSRWPQAPLLLRPKPNSGTKILGIRKDGTQQYLWQPNTSTSNRPWWKKLQADWASSPQGSCDEATLETPGQDENENDNDNDNDNECYQFCEYCVVLPINNGNESPSESLVVDFETPGFQGTLLFRLRYATGTTPDKYDDEQGFFAGKALRYQAILRGRFRDRVPFCQLVTGTRLDRPCGKLPPKWVLWTALKVVAFFAPQLSTKLDKGTLHPHVLSPLGSTPRTVTVENDKGDGTIDSASFLSAPRTEPTEAQFSLTGQNNPVADPLERARARKRQLDRWYLAQTPQPATSLNKVYTMEFLQHLFDYQRFSIEVGSHYSVKDLLDGQPLQLMAERGLGGDSPATPSHHRHDDGGGGGGDHHTAASTLWAFEIWNECLWQDAVRHAALSSK